MTETSPDPFPGGGSYTDPNPGQGGSSSGDYDQGTIQVEQES